MSEGHFTNDDRDALKHYVPIHVAGALRRLLADRDRLVEELEHTEASHVDEEAAHAETIARCDRLAEQCARLRSALSAIANASSVAQQNQAVMQARAALSEEGK